MRDTAKSLARFRFLYVETKIGHFQERPVCFSFLWEYVMKIQLSSWFLNESISKNGTDTDFRCLAKQDFCEQN